jgi:2-polyprenyl-6-methoxyphenol hydroxylase-like FAD-dependent oxidoreductase
MTNVREALQSEVDADVLVVGAGPTGLMLANQLARRGIGTTIIDRHAGPVRETRALGVQARTLEIYAHLGIIDEALALGTPGTGANLWANGRRMARVPLSDAGRQVTPYPYILILGQADNERLLGARLADRQLAVQWNTELTEFEQDDDHVVATLKTPAGTMRPFTARWVAGCDGAHSPVRKLCNIDFPGAPYEHVFFVADTIATGTMVPGEVNVYLWRDGFHLFFPMRGEDHWRLVGILPEGMRERPDVTFDDVVPSLRTEAGDALAFRECMWFSTYRISHRSAARFRAGRAFVLGDAAHIHSPVGAQGMNTGLQDAYNLGWKLALVVQGRADAALLDSYEGERLPVARNLLNTTDRGFRLIVSDNPLAGIFRTKVLARIGAFVMKRPGIQLAAFRTVSQTGIQYRKSTLSQSSDDLPEHAPRAGDRFPWMHLQFAPDGPAEDVFARLDDARFNLLLFGQRAPDGLPLGADLLRVHVVPVDGDNTGECARAGVPSPSFYLVRPDGYVGLCGLRLDPQALRRYLEERLHFAPRNDR